MSFFKPDGSGWRARIGLLSHADLTVSESEFWTMAPTGVSVHTARVPFHDVHTFAEPPGPDDATEVLAKLQPQCIVYAFTVGSYLLGTDGEQALVARLEQHSGGVRVVMPCVAAIAGFHALGVRRIALFHPPWYSDEIDAKGVAYFQNHGFEIVQAEHFTPTAEVPHPNYGQTVSSRELYEWVHKHAPSTADGVFIAGNGWHTIAVIAALEEDLGRPVITGSQAPMWYALRLSGVEARADDYGQLFRKDPDRDARLVAAGGVGVYGS